jgi:hypothetical protein
MEAKMQLANQIKEQMTALKTQRDRLIKECHRTRIHDCIVEYLSTKSPLPQNIESYIETQTAVVLAKWYKCAKDAEEMWDSSENGAYLSKIETLDPATGPNDEYLDLLDYGTIFDDYGEPSE